MLGRPAAGPDGKDGGVGVYPDDGRAWESADGDAGESELS